MVSSKTPKVEISQEYPISIPWKIPVVFLTIPQFGISYIIQFHPINQIYPWTGGYSMIVGYKIPYDFPSTSHTSQPRSLIGHQRPQGVTKKGIGDPIHQAWDLTTGNIRNWEEIEVFSGISSRCSHSPTQNHHKWVKLDINRERLWEKFECTILIKKGMNRNWIDHTRIGENMGNSKNLICGRATPAKWNHPVETASCFVAQIPICSVKSEWR